MAFVSSMTLPNTPRRRRRSVISAKQRSPRFSQLELVGVKWVSMRLGWFGQPVATSGPGRAMLSREPRSAWDTSLCRHHRGLAAHGTRQPLYLCAREKVDLRRGDGVGRRSRSARFALMAPCSIAGHHQPDDVDACGPVAGRVPAAGDLLRPPEHGRVDPRDGQRPRMGAPRSAAAPCTGPPS